MAKVRQKKKTGSEALASKLQNRCDKQSVPPRGSGWVNQPHLRSGARMLIIHPPATARWY